MGRKCRFHCSWKLVALGLTALTLILSSVIAYFGGKFFLYKFNTIFWQNVWSIYIYYDILMIGWCLVDSKLFLQTVECYTQMMKKELYWKHSSIVHCHIDLGQHLIWLFSQHELSNWYLFPSRLSINWCYCA